MTGGLVGISCMCIAAGVYSLVRGKLPPPFVRGAGFSVLNPPPAVVRRWGISLLLFGVALGALGWMNVSTRHA